LLTNARELTEQIGRLSVSVDAAIATLRTLDPSFEGKYEMQLLSNDAVAAKTANQNMLTLLNRAIQDLDEEQVPGL
jgi:hypothetical protein